VNASILMVLLGTASCGIGGWLYFQRYEMPRPPLGVLNLGDVAFTFACIIIVPMLYLLLPIWFVMGLLLLASFSLVYFALEPMLPRALVWGLTTLLMGADLAAGFALGTDHPGFLVVNNLVVIISVISIANAWTGSGMKAREAAILSGLLIGYDFIATAQLSVMGDLFTRLTALPLAPMVAWGQGQAYASIALGDLLLLTLFPLTLWKGYGAKAGLIALGVGLAAVALLMVVPRSGLFPLMVVLGPLMVVQYLWWGRNRPERKWKEFRAAAKPR